MAKSIDSANREARETNVNTRREANVNTYDTCNVKHTLRHKSISPVGFTVSLRDNSDNNASYNPSASHISSDAGQCEHRAANVKHHRGNTGINQENKGKQYSKSNTINAFSSGNDKFQCS